MVHIWNVPDKVEVLKTDDKWYRTDESFFLSSEFYVIVYHNKRRKVFYQEKGLLLQLIKVVLREY